MTINVSRELFPLVRASNPETVARQEENSWKYDIYQLSEIGLFFVPSRSVRELGHIVAFAERLDGPYGSCDCYGFQRVNRDRIGRSEKRAACIHLVAVAKRFGYEL